MNKKVKIIIMILIFILLIIGFFLFFNPFLVIKLKGNSLIEIEYNTDYIEPGYVARIYGKKLTNKVIVDGNVDTTKVGSYQISYKVKNGLSEKVVNRIVLVTDKTAPVLTLVGEKIINICPNVEYEDEGYTAIDDYDGDITSLVEVDKASGLISYSVKDSSGNESKLERQINIVDEEKPTITIKGNREVTVIVNDNYSDQGAIANDNCDGDISDSIIINNTVDTSKIGTYEVVYTVKDYLGNESNAKRIVKVVEKQQETGW